MPVVTANAQHSNRTHRSQAYQEAVGVLTGVSSGKDTFARLTEAATSERLQERYTIDRDRGYEDMHRSAQRRAVH